MTILISAFLIKLQEPAKCQKGIWLVLLLPVMTCIPNEPFSFILGENRLKSITKDTTVKTESCEPHSLQRLEADFNTIADGLSKKPSEPYIATPNTLIYKQKNCSEKQFIKIGWSELTNFELLKTHRNVIVSCKDSIKYAITRFGLS